ncbi:glycosyltransferase family 2 protein [Streptomyces sp. NPDC020965]|uniref:glycosyltransferase family 2 protein n=1 Tax=Streptomyces sp. NPDC020965 TaxID=3365105 RepID=UPI0037AB088A
MTSPDVTVVVAVYNTMPYLTECLNSLVGQSIGLDRLEVVAVDDGSTDDSGAELDRFAAKYPGTVKVIHQTNSGGPAAPSNRALEVATGRFVYFLGSDDYLGKEALARMVACADQHGSDVVVGKMVGTNGRYVHQALYKKSDPDVSLYDSALPYTLANTKLFRRELVEEHGLRFPEDMPVGSDQPFTIEACVRARKISVLADYTYYYAVKRGDASNITYRADHLARMRCAERILDFAAGLIEEGPKRDHVFERHFNWELAKLIQGDFPEVEPRTRRELCIGIAGLADEYLTEPIRDALPVQRRVRLTLAQRGMVDELVEVIAAEEKGGPPPFLLAGDRAFARYTGFRDTGLVIPDRIYEVFGESVAAALASGTELESAAWEQHGDELSLAVAVRVPVAGDIGSLAVRLVQGAMPKSADKPGGRQLPAGHQLPPAVGKSTLETTADGSATVIRALIPIEARTASAGVRVHVEVAGRLYEIPVRGQDKPMPLARRWRSGTPYRVAARVNAKGRMVVATGLLFPPAERWWSRVRPLLARVKRKVSR